MTEVNSQHKHSPAEKKVLVRYGKNGLVGWFRHNERTLPKEKSKVIIKTERGLEIGEVVGKFCYRSGTFRKSNEEVEQYYQCEKKDMPIAPGGKFVRYATRQDLSEEVHINIGAADELKKCVQFVKEMKLPMKLIDVEHVFGGERIIFYFTAEDRVDFRELVKRLAKEYQTRIEMRQVGSRDAAKITADIETCGQPCCCARYLKILKPVNMKMAKLQKATLDPSKISGYCGRLKCCLRYEDKTYRELGKKLPKKRSWVKTSAGEGTVVDTQLLTQIVSIKSKDGSVFAVGVEEIQEVKPPAQGNQPTRKNNSSRRNDQGRQNSGKGGNGKKQGVRQSSKKSSNSKQQPAEQ